MVGGSVGLCVVGVCVVGLCVVGLCVVGLCVTGCVVGLCVVGLCVTGCVVGLCVCMYVAPPPQLLSLCLVPFQSFTQPQLRICPAFTSIRVRVCCALYCVLLCKLAPTYTV